MGFFCGVFFLDFYFGGIRFGCGMGCVSDLGLVVGGNVELF